MKHLLRILLFSLCFTGLSTAWAQENFPINDISDVRSGAYAFTNATIFVDYQTKIDKATLLIKDGKVVDAGSNINIPKGYVTVGLEGKYIYPSFIDAYTNYGMPEVKRGRFSWGSTEKIEPLTDGAYNANDGIKTDFQASETFKADKKEAKEMRKAGFGTALTFRPDGFARGTSTVTTLADANENLTIIKGQAASHYSFDKGSSEQYYPVSAMGFVAVLRQTHFDADWYKSKQNTKLFDNTLEAYNAQRSLPQVFDTDDWQELLRAANMGQELGKKYIYKTGGDDYRRLNEIKALNASLIVPLDFPKGYEISDPLDAMDVSLTKLKHWELAPSNPARLANAGVEFALTTADLKKKSDFMSNLRKAVEHGLSEEMALKALTVTPAKLTGVADQVGDLKKGKLANFLVTSGNIFDDKSIIHENWVQGNRYDVKEEAEMSYAGNYKLMFDGKEYKMEIGGKAAKPSFKIFTNDTTSVDAKGSIKDGMMTLGFTLDKEKKEGDFTRLSGWFNDATANTDYAFNGKAKLADGSMADWSARFESALEEKEKKDKKEEDDKKPEMGEVIYPFLAYGAPTLPKAEDFIIKNATVWTNEAEGILENADVIVRNGKISKVGKNLEAKGLKEIDGTGKHVTAGIIDEHSHIALRSVNDVDVVSAQVRMSDVVDSDDVNIYRQLSGGVTAAQLLHGSANPVGGQSALIKLRWGHTPQEMLIKNADGFIKFALGENVKRSSSSSSIRYPQTRMGVEQVYMDAFTQAKEYDQAWKAYNSLSAKDKQSAAAPRRDAKLETLAEILNGKRFITCHSYIQSEINMLMKVAEHFNFRVNTFTHILEGYKVADKMKNHGVGASTFSDWWAYKYEVKEAIPYNPILMHKEGVVVAINSDDAEMGRRLNQEAAKSVKYGGMSEEDALKMVTLNPAKLLHLDNRMGSIKEGKDADIVLWTDNPLSIYAKASMTFVDGISYYDMERDATLSQYIEDERNRIVQKMQEEGGGAKPTPSMRPRFHCEDVIHLGGN